MRPASGVPAAFLLLTVAPVAAQPDGARIWEMHCASCHGPDGRPTLPEVPDLASRPVLLSESELVELIREGRGGMPGFRFVLGESEILAVVEHLRSLGW